MLDGLCSLVEAKAAAAAEPKKLVAEGNNGSGEAIVYLYMFPIPAEVEEMILLAEVKREGELREVKSKSVDFEGGAGSESGIGGSKLGFFEESSDWVLV
ncbi:hypothetical protein Scep_015965 [Stephania cephalantha]|uniref:Uncharacterized protein n=1 Tax=Stephania cephalantha TaxID=152367 RepID=A0AAP0INN1_9MAGN